MHGLRERPYWYGRAPRSRNPYRDRIASRRFNRVFEGRVNRESTRGGPFEPGRCPASTHLTVLTTVREK
jgi:hypothetical protein